MVTAVKIKDDQALSMPVPVSLYVRFHNIHIRKLDGNNANKVYLDRNISLSRLFPVRSLGNF